MDKKHLLKQLSLCSSIFPRNIFPTRSSLQGCAGREPPPQSPFLPFPFLLLKRESSEGGRRGLGLSRAAFLWLGWGGRAILLSCLLDGAVLAANTCPLPGWLLGLCGVDTGCTELGPGDEPFPSTWTPDAPSGRTVPSRWHLRLFSASEGASAHENPPTKSQASFPTESLPTLGYSWEIQGQRPGAGTVQAHQQPQAHGPPGLWGQSPTEVSQKRYPCHYRNGDV